MVLVIDNYDSFTYNLVQYLGELGAEVVVRRNNEVSLDEIEPTQRGPYAGAVGYVSYSGNLDSCITIRTIVCHGRRASIQVGAGIVADSDPKTEWQETCSKARGLVLALRIAATSGRP